MFLAVVAEGTAAEGGWPEDLPQCVTIWMGIWPENSDIYLDYGLSVVPACMLSDEQAWSPFAVADLSLWVFF